MAHEIRNPLGLIRNHSYLLRHATNQNDPMIKKSLSQIDTSVEKAGSIIDNLLNFSRLDNEDNENIYIHDFINEIFQLEKKLMSSRRIKYEIQCSRNLSYKINREVLKHIVINLTANAIDAMPQGGKLVIKGEISNNNLILKFKDTGIGISKKNIENIFNPFFTTKKRGKGTGLGLYIVYSDIKRYGGQINVESETGKGSEFSLTLPVKSGETNESI
jgi:polar amino acid transport system substrate-binding protein